MKTMNTISKLLLLVILAGTSLAHAQSSATTRTFEALATTVRMPVSPNGTITLRESENTDFETVRVTPRTRYLINHKSMRLDQFRKAIQGLLQKGEFTINIRRDEASQTAATVFVYVD